MQIAALKAALAPTENDMSESKPPRKRADNLKDANNSIARDTNF